LAASNATLEYTKNAVLTSSRAKLVVLMYEGAIRFVEQARYHMQKGNNAACGTAISNAYNVVSELKIALDHEAGGEIGKQLSGQLEGLYVFIMEQLVQANLNRTEEGLEDVIEILTTLESAWREVAGQI